jgi:DNA replication protein
MFEHWDTNEIVRLAAAGGGFEIDASLRPTNDLIRIAAAAGGKGARVVFRGLTPRPVDELIRIAAAGQGCVSFTEASV